MLYTPKLIVCIVGGASFQQQQQQQQKQYIDFVDCILAGWSQQANKVLL